MISGFFTNTWINCCQKRITHGAVLSDQRRTKCVQCTLRDRRNVYIFLGEIGGTREFIKFWNAKFNQKSSTSPVFQVFIKINNLNQRKVILRGEKPYVDILKTSQFNEMYTIIKNSANLACNITCDEFRLLKGFLKSANCKVVVDLSGFRNSFMGRTDIF